jgi:hypothetical protein
VIEALYDDSTLPGSAKPLIAWLKKRAIPRQP